METVVRRDCSYPADRDGVVTEAVFQIVPTAGPVRGTALAGPRAAPIRGFTEAESSTRRRAGAEPHRKNGVRTEPEDSEDSTSRAGHPKTGFAQPAWGQDARSSYRLLSPDPY